jgi:hypothetical protein
MALVRSAKPLFQASCSLRVETTVSVRKTRNMARKKIATVILG